MHGWLPLASHIGGGGEGGDGGARRGQRQRGGASRAPPIEGAVKELQLTNHGLHLHHKGLFPGGGGPVDDCGIAVNSLELLVADQKARGQRGFDQRRGRVLQRRERHSVAGDESAEAVGASRRRSGACSAVVASGALGRLLRRGPAAGLKSH